MVTTTQSDVSSTTVHGRGFVTEEPVLTGHPVYVGSLWRPVIAGSLFALSLMSLSWYLMLGCHVGVTQDGFLALGGGSAVWICVTAAIAFFFGGMITSCMSAASSVGGAIKGAVLWGLSLPLALVIYSLAAHTAVLSALSMPQAAINNAPVTAVSPTMGHFGFYWATFIALGIALIFSIIGSMSGYGVGTNRGGDNLVR